MAHDQGVEHGLLPPRTPLGLLMLAQGWITHRQMRKALDEQLTAGSGRFGDWLIQECGVNPNRVTEALSIQQACPILDQGSIHDEDLLSILPTVLSHRYGCLPLRSADDHFVHLGVSTALPAAHLEALRHMTGMTFRQGLIPNDLYANLSRQLKGKQPVQPPQRGHYDGRGLAREVATLVDKHRGVDSSLVCFGSYLWLRFRMGPTSAVGRDSEVSGVTDYIFEL